MSRDIYNDLRIFSQANPNNEKLWAKMLVLKVREAFEAIRMIPATLSTGTYAEFLHELLRTYDSPLVLSEADEIFLKQICDGIKKLQEKCDGA